jgi:hypothetical protein
LKLAIPSGGNGLVEIRESFAHFFVRRDNTIGTLNAQSINCHTSIGMKFDGVAKLASSLKECFDNDPARRYAQGSASVFSIDRELYGQAHGQLFLWTGFWNLEHRDRGRGGGACAPAAD